MRKYIILGSALICAFCLFSSVTAVPQSQSIPLTKALTEIEEQQESIESYLDELVSRGTLDGLFDWFLRLIQWLTEVIGTLFSIVNGLIQIVSLLMTLLSVIQILLDLIDQIMDWFNPEIRACTG